MKFEDIESFFHKVAPKAVSNAVKDWQRGGAPKIKETTGERVVVYNCLKDAYDKDPDRILTELHFIFDTMSYAENARPERIRKVIREEIYLKVARIEDTELLDKVIDSYAYVYTTNTSRKVNIR